MLTPLPGGQADELMWHLTQCRMCRVARSFRTPYCKRGRELVRLTLKERHGDE